MPCAEAGGPQSDAASFAAQLAITDQALQRNPNNCAFLARKAQVLLDIDEPAQAAEWFNKAIKFAPEKAKAALYEKLAQAYYSSRQLEQAGAAYESVLRCNADKSLQMSAHFGLASVFEDQNKYPKALEQLGMNLKLSPSAIFVLEARANLFRKMKRYKEAEADMSAAVKLNPTNSILYIKRAQIYDLLGEKDLAKKDRKSADSIVSDPLDR